MLDYLSWRLINRLLWDCKDFVGETSSGLEPRRLPVLLDSGASVRVGQGTRKFFGDRKGIPCSAEMTVASGKSDGILALTMSFTEIPFVWFLLVVLAVYHTAGALRLRGAWQWGWLAVASLFFYGFKEPRLLLLLGFSISFNAWAGWCIARQVASERLVSRGFMGLALTVNLGLIVAFKYAGLIGGLVLPDSWASTKEWLQKIPLPIGISFYTFHAVSFLVDLSRAGGKETALRPFCQELAGGSVVSGLGKLALYINFFPQLVSGPIMKAREFLPQIEARHPRQIAWRQALRYLILGFFLKQVVADNLAEHTNLLAADTTVISQMGKLDLLLLLFGFSMQIFADFGGYSVIALGLAGLFGYRLPINFNFPYLAASITEFWRRWHISLSNWLRDYLYFPLGGNRKGVARTYLNLFLVMFIGGLWHGAGWKFAWWGAAHGVLLMLERWWGVTVDETSVRHGSALRWLRILLTFCVTSFLWLLFKLPDLAHLQTFLTTLWKGAWTVNPRLAYAIGLFSLPLIIYHVWGYYRPNWRVKIATNRSGAGLEALAYGVMLYFIITNPGASSAFLYFQF